MVAITQTAPTASLTKRLAIKLGDLTKDDEIATLQAFIEAVPRNSYLGDYLQGSLDYFAQLVRSDMVEPMTTRHRDVATELEAERAKLLELRKQVAAEQLKLNGVQQAIKSCKREIQSVSKGADSMRESIDYIRRLAVENTKE